MRTSHNPASSTSFIASALMAPFRLFSACLMPRKEVEEPMVMKFVRPMPKCAIGEVAPLAKEDFKTTPYHAAEINLFNSTGSLPRLCNMFGGLTDPEIEFDKLSFPLSNGEFFGLIRQIAPAVLSITRDLKRVAHYLADLDAELGSELSLTPVEAPYLMTGNGYFIPGAPPEGYQYLDKGKLLDKILLRNEMKHGINREGYAAKFVGFVESAVGDDFVASGHLFAEEKQLERIIFHGSYSHRLMFYILCRAIADKHIILTYGKNKELTVAQFLEFIVRSSCYSDASYLRLSLWAMFFDNAVDAMYGWKDTFNPENYNFSCRLPHVFNSLLLCFGSELKLPNLQAYLLDSHWKAVRKMMIRLRGQDAEYQHASDDTLYCMLMDTFTAAHKDPGLLGGNSPLLPTKAELQSRTNYEPLPISQFIVRRR